MNPPGWNSLETTTSIHRFFEIGGIVVLAVLVVFEALAYLYGHRRDGLQQQHQATDAANTINGLKQDSERKLADTTRTLNDRNEASEKKIAELKAKAAPRRLTQQQKAEVAAVAKQYPGQRFKIMYVNTAEADTPRFAEDFDELLETSWNRIAITESNNFPVAPIGIEVWVNSAYGRTVANPPEAATALLNAIFKLGFFNGSQPLLTRSESVEIGDVMLVIGRRQVPPN